MGGDLDLGYGLEELIGIGRVGTVGRYDFDTLGIDSGGVGGGDG